MRDVSVEMPLRIGYSSPGDLCRNRGQHHSSVAFLLKVSLNQKRTEEKEARRVEKEQKKAAKEEWMRMDRALKEQAKRDGSMPTPACVSAAVASQSSSSRSAAIVEKRKKKKKERRTRRSSCSIP